jgi:hypothetical protein
MWHVYDGLLLVNQCAEMATMRVLVWFALSRARNFNLLQQKEGKS